MLSIEDYRQLTNCQSSIIDLLAIPADVDIDFEPVRLSGPLYKMAYFLDVFTRYQRRFGTLQSQVVKIRCKGDRMGGGVSASSLFVSVVTILELETGISLIERRHPS